MRASTYRKRTRGITRRSPPPPPVQAKALVEDDPADAAAAERFGVGLALDLEHVQGQQHDLANANQRAGRRVHDGLARLLAKGGLEVGAIVGAEVVAHHGLAAVLVYPLRHLVAGGVAQARE